MNKTKLPQVLAVSMLAQNKCVNQEHCKVLGNFTPCDENSDSDY
jgi:hypothetical protein